MTYNVATRVSSGYVGPCVFRIERTSADAHSDGRYINDYVYMFSSSLPCGLSRGSRARRDRDGRREGGGGGGGGQARDEPAEDMSTSLLDMDASKLYAQVWFWSVDTSGITESIDVPLMNLCAHGGIGVDRLEL